MSNPLSIVIVGGGAAGFFAALACAEAYPQHTIRIIEKSKQLLSKVRISGGGRCNVTHACFDPSLLVKNYPRGSKELRGPFSRFNPTHTIEWFSRRGVDLKTEEDGRMFPITDNSQTVIDCLTAEAKRLNIEIITHQSFEDFSKNEAGQFILTFSRGESIVCDRLMIATGSAPLIYPLLEKKGHTIIPLVPSLFTFNLPMSPFLDLAGISVSSAQVKLPLFRQSQTGPLLLTHWGISGPAVLKLSAWAARELFDADYKTEVEINWISELTEEDVRQKIMDYKLMYPARLLSTDSPVELPKQLWKRLVELVGISDRLKWVDLSHKMLQELVKIIRCTKLQQSGKTTYKQEFVTCGGVALDQIDFKTMESRQLPGLFFGGEILNIDGVTGGFNFQNAWTTGWIAGHAMGI